MKVSFSDRAPAKTGTLVATVFADGEMGAIAKSVDEATDGLLTKVMARRNFDGSAGKLQMITKPAGVNYHEVILLGLGAADKFSATDFEEHGGKLFAALSDAGIESADLALDLPEGELPLEAPELAARIGFGAVLRDYRFEKYKTKAGKSGDDAKDDKAEKRLTKLKIVTRGVAKARTHFTDFEAVAEAVHKARDLVSEPANELYPESYAKRCKELEKLGLEVEILDQKTLEKKGFKSLLSVGHGSERDSALVVMRWAGADAGKPAKGKAKGKGKSKKKTDFDSAPIAFIGKGITFDTGGISLKPPAGMGDMKWDMAGSAAVVGAMAALAGRKAKVNAVGVIALAENMPSGRAIRPGDIIGSLSGQSIEVLNTDAEGRLVLADALWYTEDRFKPVAMIDLATLTGAIIIALGKEFGGMFTDSDELADGLTAAGKTVGEKVWRMPLDPAFDRMLNTDAADMKNIGGRDAGSATAAQFLKRFVRDVPWAHLDIAGMAWSGKTTPRTPKGGTAFGVRLLDQLVRDNYEK
ncbi:MAG: leucyl aminopeptidase [Alphaproteobacteria bacterium]|nr:leucyl aminopeptidase [Alphaproteobacteria bacterium SS10]